MQAEVVPKILHFQPPYGIVRARADRGSPMFTDPDSQSITQLRPATCYQYIFPKKRFNLDRVSYYFEHEMDDVLDEPHYARLVDSVSDWQRKWARPNRPSLQYRKTLKSIRIEDRRGRRRRTYTYRDRQAALYEFCADARTLHDIAGHFETDVWMKEALNGFINQGLMLLMDGRYLSLALPENQNFKLPPRRAEGVLEIAEALADSEATPLVELRGQAIHGDL